MSKYICNEEMKAKIEDLQRGLHAAMDALIRSKDYARAERVLHEMDFHFAQCLRDIQIAVKR